MKVVITAFFIFMKIIYTIFTHKEVNNSNAIAPLHISHTALPDQNLKFNQWAKHIRRQINKSKK